MQVKSHMHHVQAHSSFFTISLRDVLSGRQHDARGAVNRPTERGAIPSLTRAVDPALIRCLLEGFSSHVLGLGVDDNDIYESGYMGRTSIFPICQAILFFVYFYLIDVEVGCLLSRSQT